MGDTVRCGQCHGTGKVQVPRTNSKGETIMVEEDCKGCYGSGVIPS